MMNQNKFPAASGLFLRLCPTGQPAIQMTGNHTALFNPETAASRSRCGAISHKVWAAE
jgi:hypothetical protein